MIKYYIIINIWSWSFYIPLDVEVDAVDRPIDQDNTSVYKYWQITLEYGQGYIVPTHCDLLVPLYLKEKWLGRGKKMQLKYLNLLNKL
jgi:hypothetical protein